MTATFLRIASLAPAVALCFGTTDAQPRPSAVTVMLRGVPSCSACTITLSRGAILDTRDSLTFSLNAGLARMRDGGILAWGFKADHPGPILFDSTGRVARILMRRGQGPGEIGYAMHVAITASDTVLVYDVTEQRHVLSPMLSFVRREAGVFPPTSAVLRADGTGIVSLGTMNTNASLTLPLHAVATNGSIVGSFGLESLPRDPRVSDPDPTLALEWRVVPGASGRVWSYTAYKAAGFRVEERNAAGERLRSFQHANDGWYGQIPKDGPEGSMTWQVVPSAQPNLIWIVYTVRTPRVPIPPRGRSIPNDLSPYVSGFDVVVEAVDLGRNQVIAVQRFTGASARPVANAPDTMALVVPLSADLTTLQIARLSLRRVP